MNIRAGLPITNSLSLPNPNTQKYPFGTLGGFIKDHETDKTFGITTYHSVHTSGLRWKTFHADQIDDQDLLHVSVLSEDRKHLKSIGKIARTFFDNKVEAALIEFFDGFEPQGQLSEAKTCHFSLPKKDQEVTKLGAKTDKTNSIFNELLTEKEGFVYKGKPTLHEYSRLMSIENPSANRFVKGGDSGSLIKLGNQIAGMVLGKNEERELAFGMHAYLIKRKLDITFLNHTTT